ncbi:alpha/beta hydrolase [Aeromicrobium massiliense]|uniref:alpha/beta hydrolase n=1 Tax=Aeromicrobium massiliense TaxID=1464554 RepID=UPI0002F549C8|nr:alpha/beta hydrolase [Aeromicrobium massiliense]
MTRLRPYLLPLAVVVVVGAIVAALVLVLERDRSTAAAPEPTGEKGPAGLERFYGQQPEWTDCGDDDARCAWIEVPLDYAEPIGKTIRLRAREIPATGDDVQGHVVVNPGGPGGAALDFAGQVAAVLDDDVRETYGVVGVDPRGVGSSEPALDCLTDAELDAWTQVDSTPDDDAEVEALREASLDFGRGCVDRSGALASHVSTVEAARDLDVVRAVLGDDELTYYGASYGTSLGSTYAALFPQKAARLVLDGAIAPDLTPAEGALGQNEGFQRALTAYLEDCVADDCPLGDDVESAEQTLGDAIEELDAKPLKVGDRELTQTQAFYGVATPLYGEQNWPILTAALGQLLDGNGAGLLQLSDFYFDRGPDGRYASNSAESFRAISCLDATGEPAPSPDEAERLADQLREVSPVFGPFFAGDSSGCEGWPARSEAAQAELDVAAPGAPPILVVGTTRDPATPYEWSQRLADALDSGVLLTREGDGHTALGQGNECIDDAIATFLLDGEAPKDGTVCEE